jgi:hypothetical protein
MAQWVWLPTFGLTSMNYQSGVKPPHSKGSAAPFYAQAARRGSGS